MIDLKNVKVQFEEVIVKECDIHIPSEKITLIKGVSGSGKSSLLYRIGLFSDDTSYGYFLDDTMIDLNDEKCKSTVRHKHLTFVLQDNLLFDQYDVIGNMQLYSSFTSKQYDSQWYRDILDTVRLKVPFQQSIGTLSKGERQRLAIACALCKDTDVLILDEPTSHLDHENERVVFEILRRIKDELHKTIIISSHSNVAEEYADVIYEITDKECYRKLNCDEIPQGNTEDIFQDTKFSLKFYLKYIGYFFQRYRKFETGMIAMFVICLCLMSGMFLYAESRMNDSIYAYEELSENQMFITASDNALYIDEKRDNFTFACEGAEVYPYYDTYAMIGGYRYTVLPLFENNDTSKLFRVMDGSDRIYCSYQAYENMLRIGSETENESFEMIIRTGNNTMKEGSKRYRLAGVLPVNRETDYLKNEDCYIYCDISLLNDLYDECLTGEINEAGGYTVITDDYDSYVAIYQSLNEKEYGVNAFFTEFEMIERLKQSSLIIRMMITAAGILISLILFTAIEIQYFRKRSIEFMMLKMNGMNSTDMDTLMLIETIIMQGISVLVSDVLIVIVSFIWNIDVMQILLISIFYATVLCIGSYLINHRFTSAISVEKILRA